MRLPERAALIADTAALGVALDDSQSRTLLTYLDLLEKWNRVYNLTAVRGREAMLTHHLLDSLAAVAPLRRWTQGRAVRLLDVGSGAGLPGIVLATLLPESELTCIDAVGKKASFIRQAAGELGLANLRAVHARVETFRDEGFDVITSRAFASLADFVRLTRPRLSPGGVWMGMKGRLLADELAALPSSIDVFHVEQLAVPRLGAERCLVWMKERS